MSKVSDKGHDMMDIGWNVIKEYLPTKRVSQKEHQKTIGSP